MKTFAIFFLALFCCVTVADAGTDLPTRKSGPATQVSLVNPIAQDLLVDQFDVTDISGFYTAQNFEAGLEVYDNEMADDFTVPAGYQWLLEDLVFYGAYYNCGITGFPPCGPTMSFTVTFYADAGGMPGAIAAGPYDIVSTDVLDTMVCDPVDGCVAQTFYILTFPVGVVVGPGTYWVGAAANMGFATAGQVGIADNDIQHGNLPKWRNPGGGFGIGCTSWGTARTCFGVAAPAMSDYTWQLYGESQIACADIRNFTAICKRDNGRIQPKLTFFTTAHSGESVTFLIDGTEADATVVSAGTRAIAKTGISGYAPGMYTVGVVDPYGCFEEIMVTCEAPGAPEEADEDADEVAFGGVTPEATALQGNYPNPFNPSTTIRYALSQDSWVSLKVFNTLGQEVATLVNEFQHAGSMAAVWNGRNEYGATVASGIYIYRLTTDNIVLSEKMLFMK